MKVKIVAINKPAEKHFKRHGVRIKDAKRDRYIHIIGADIKGSKCRDHQRCAFAKAIQRMTGAEWVDVSNTRVLIKTGKRTAERYLLQKEAREQVRFFDTNKGRMAPGTVRLLSARHTTDRIGAPRHARSKPGTPTTRPTRKPTR